jgi:aromatic ring hydroxylase
MIDILKNVGEGIMDRESGIMAIMAMYGVSRAEAEKIVPDYNPPEAPAAPVASKPTSDPKK